MADTETASLKSSTSVASERYRILLEISNAVIACQTPDDIIEVINAQLQPFIAFDRVSLSLYDWEKGTIRFFAVSKGLPSTNVKAGRAFNLNANHPGAEFDRQYPVLRNDLSTGQRNEIEEIIYAEGIHSYCVVPLVLRDYNIGTLNVASRARDQYKTEDADFLQDIARQITLVVWNLYSYEKLRAEVEQRRLVEESLRESEEFKTRLIEGSHDCIKVLDLDGRLLSMNAGGMKILEICDFNPLCNSRWVEFWQGEYRAAAEAAVISARSGGIGHFVGFCPTMLGKPMWWDVVVNPILGTDGKPEKLLALSRDITERKRAEIMLRALVEGTASVTGKDFFRSLVQHLAEAIPVRYAFVTECANPERTRARMLAFWKGEGFATESEYDVANTTCEQVYAGDLCFYQKEIQKLFPAETALVDLGGESYIGIPLLNSAGDFIGHLAVIDVQAMDSPRGLDVLKIFAARAGAELERKKAEDDLHKALKEVEQLKNQLHAENIYLQEEIRCEHNFEEIVGSSPALLAVLQQVERIAPTDATVLILGETGTGKELIARAIHDLSPRRQRPLVKVNCGAISAGLVESELFGHVKGAFTGAIDKRSGRFELADGGTLFLDEVGELPMDTQVKLLRVLQEGEFEPVGSSKTVRVDVRIIAATNRHLETEVTAGRFRADLFYRLNVLPLHNPSLRERREDISQLVMFFLSRYSKRFGRQVNSVAHETMELLLRYDWPGNIRELQNLIERAVILANGSVLTIDHNLLTVPQSSPLPPLAQSPAGISEKDASVTAQKERLPETWIAAQSAPSSLAAASPAASASLEEIERQHILNVLTQTNWVIEGDKGAARTLNLHPNTLRSRLKKMGIQRPRG